MYAGIQVCSNEGPKNNLARKLNVWKYSQVVLVQVCPNDGPLGRVGPQWGNHVLQRDI